ncbi:MAG: GNAT family N-acetyltransferase [Betaproteobacteria bacterium]
MKYTLSVSDVADEEVRKVILASLVEFNTSKAGPGRGATLAVALRNASGAVVGGLWGSTGYGWLFTQLLAVPASMRGQGVGTEIMQCAEREAIARGCHGAWLDTFEFQARAFYEGLGYICFAELPDYPPGYSRFFMKKALVAE